MDIKVLKSFVSAHDAVNWASQNRIEDTSIETTSTLKSMGMGPVPSGNYHIVLKAGRVSGAIGDLQNAQGPDKFPADANIRGGIVTDDTRFNQAANFVGARNPTEHAEAVGENPGKIDKTNMDAYRRRMGRLGALAGAMENAYREHGTGLYQPLVGEEEEVGKSLSYDDLVEVITKSIMDVLKAEDEDYVHPEVQRARDALAAKDRVKQELKDKFNKMDQDKKERNRPGGSNISYY